MNGGAGGNRERWRAAVRVPIVAAVAAVAVMAVASPATAQERPAVIVETTTPTLAERDDGGWTVDVTLVNLTGELLALTSQPGDLTDRGCRPEVPAELPPAEMKAVKVTVPAICRLTDERFEFEIDAETAAGDTVASIGFTAGPKPDDESEPDWGILIVFPVLLAGLAVLAAVWLVAWIVAGDSGRGPATPLAHLDKSWSLKESWASNLTLGTALVTGVFGSSSVVTAMLGEDAEAAMAVVVVGSAGAAALVAVGPLILALTRTSDGSYSAGGLFAAAVFTLTGAFAELAVVADTASRLDLGGWEDAVPVAAFVVALVLVAYTARTLASTLRTGTTEPAKPEPSDTIVAAGLIVDALNRDRVQMFGRDSLDRVLESFEPRPARPTAALL